MEDKRSKVRSIIKSTQSLPAIPGIIAKLNSLSADKKASIHDMARIVSSDQGLCARTLRLVNSPSYGFSRVSTITNAMILLGVDVVASLCLSSSIFQIMETSVLGLWEHSLGAGTASTIIARKLGLSECAEISTAALLHDIGKIIIKSNFEDDYKQILAMVTTREISFSEAELELLGADHAELGGWLATSWLLPEKLIEPIICHHEVHKSSAHQTKTAVVHLADVLIKASGFGLSGDEYVPQIHPMAWQKLEMNERLLDEIVEELEEKLIEVKNFSMEIQASHGH